MKALAVGQAKSASEDFLQILKRGLTVLYLHAFVMNGEYALPQRFALQHPDTLEGFHAGIVGPLIFYFTHGRYIHPELLPYYSGGMH